MAQAGYTPISLYYSSTPTNVPLNTDLVSGELAINIADGKLFYKDNSNVVQVIGTKGGVGSSSTTQVLYNSSGLVVGSANLTFNGTTLTANTLNLTNVLGTTYGGTGLASFTSGGAVYATSTSALTTGTLPIASGGTGATTAAAALAALGGINTGKAIAMSMIFGG